jgi:gliding motility-associated-like protein
LVATDVTCFGANDGVIDLSVSNGLAPYSYEWSNNADTEDLSGLAPGTYNVTVTDANGCLMEGSTSISQPDPLAVTSELTHVLCNSGDNGAIDLNVTGGVEPYTFEWSNDATTEDISDLVAGTYAVIITDANECTLDYSVIINEPAALEIQHLVYNSTCNAPNGSIQVQVVGGVTPYSYEWSDGSTNLNLNNVVAGVYTLVVTDANGCTSEVTDSIFSESNILAEVTSSDVTCFGRNNGVARVSVIAGNAPFFYQWSTGDTTAIISGLAPGVYTVIVTDAYGCEADLIIEILEPELLEVTLEPSLYSGGYNVFPYDGDNGFIDAVVTGGTEPYSYYWNDGQSTSGINNLTAGTYSVVVTDENGCTASATINLNQPLVLEMPNGYSPNGDGKNDYFVVRGLDGYPSNEFTVFNRWGNIVYQRNDYDNTWNGENNFGEPLPDATYFVILNVDAPSGTITLKGYVDLRR